MKTLSTDNIAQLLGGRLELMLDDGHATPHQVGDILDICNQMIESDNPEALVADLTEAVKSAYEEQDASRILDAILG